MEIREGFFDFNAPGLVLMESHGHLVLADAYRLAGNGDQGLFSLGEPLTSAKSQEKIWSAELSRLEGELLLLKADAHEDHETVKAEILFRRAIDIARGQDAKSLELRATTSLAHLFARADRRDEARVSSRAVALPLVVARNALASESVDAVIERTGGVPLFVEELTWAVLESGPTKLSSREIPATLHDSLMARLDQLGPAKEVIQMGAVIGGDFSYELLHAVHPMAEPDLRAALRQFTDAELLYVRGIVPTRRISSSTL
jgi:hypothetical protein